MKKIRTRNYKAAGLHLVILVLLCSMIPNTVGIKCETFNMMTEKNDFSESMHSDWKEGVVSGSGTIYYFYPVNTNDFVGEQWNNGDNNYGLKGWINNTDIIVESAPISGLYRGWLFILDWELPRLYFSYTLFILPQSFKIVNYTGEICCDWCNLPHGPCWTDFSVSGVAERFRCSLPFPYP